MGNVCLDGRCAICKGVHHESICEAPPSDVVASHGDILTPTLTSSHPSSVNEDVSTTKVDGFLEHPSSTGPMDESLSSEFKRGWSLRL